MQNFMLYFHTFAHIFTKSATLPAANFHCYFTLINQHNHTDVSCLVSCALIGYIFYYL